ncbi:hypothetical protein Tco_1066204 [Tanacetum coccineum]|uniref:Xylulose kinase-1 n=1 Tax=Tanacetum coccineum TaxID=301880 RepID=A0ABQ5HB77_9ASTR
MATLKFADTHNMVAFLSKPTKSDGFKQIMDFLSAHPIRYALTVNPTIYISCVEQFWSTVKAKTINEEEQLHSLVDGKKIIIIESSVRRDLQLADEEAILEAEQGQWITSNRPNPMQTPKESSSKVTNSGGGPKVPINHVDTNAQTEVENVTKAFQ